MGNDLSDMIQTCIDAKEDNKEFALFHYPLDDENQWYAMIGNSSGCVSLGEIDGDYVGRGNTAKEAVIDLLRKLPK